jgi:TonB family protein
MRLSTSCWLLAALTATTALAQTHPKKKPVRKLAVVRHTAEDDGWRREKQENAARSTTYCHISLDLEGMPPDSQPAVDPNPIYTYVEQMPLLNGQPLGPAGVAAISCALVVPADAPEGRVFVKFVVTKEGKVSQPQIAKGLRADVDSAVVAATRKLPAFTPGKHSGWAVPVSVTLPISIVGQQP